MSEMQKLCDITASKFEDLIKLLLSIEDGDNTIIIENSKIVQTINKGTAVLKADISNLIQSNINLHILNSKKNLKLLKKIKSNDDDIGIYEDSKRFIIKSEDIEFYLPKQKEELKKTLDPKVENRNLDFFNKIIITKDKAKQIKSLIYDADHVNLLIAENNLNGVYIPETAIVNLDPENITQVSLQEQELQLKSYSFLHIDAEEYELYLGEEKEKENYWLITTMKTGLAKKIFTIEKLVKNSSESLII